MYEYICICVVVVGVYIFGNILCVFFQNILNAMMAYRWVLFTHIKLVNRVRYFLKFLLFSSYIYAIIYLLLFLLYIYIICLYLILTILYKFYRFWHFIKTLCREKYGYFYLGGYVWRHLLNDIVLWDLQCCLHLNFVVMHRHCYRDWV